MKAFEYELTHPDKSMAEEALEAVTKNRKSHLNIENVYLILWICRKHNT